MVRGAWCVVHGAWCMMHGAQRAVLYASGAWHTVRGAGHRETVHGAWCRIGAWCAVLLGADSARWALCRPSLRREQQRAALRAHNLSRVTCKLKRRTKMVRGAWCQIGVSARCCWELTVPDEHSAGQTCVACLSCTEGPQTRAG
jgi:hypothetical protein